MPPKSRQKRSRKRRAGREPQVLSRRKAYGIEREGYRYREWFEQPSGKRAAWLEVDIDEWTSAFRLAEQAGEMVVAEARFFPKEPEPEGTWIDHPELGRIQVQFWKGEESGPRPYGSWSGASERVPKGGVPARMLRHVKPGQALRLAFEASRSIPAQEGFEPRTGRRYRGKRKKRDQLLLARVAVHYEQVCEEQSRTPSKTVCERLRAEGEFYERTTVRDLIREARKQGLLTEWQRGSASAATKKARTLIKAARQATAT